jgi:hypothetical protein
VGLGASLKIFGLALSVGPSLVAKLGFVSRPAAARLFVSFLYPKRLFDSLSNLNIFTDPDKQ